MSSIPLTSVAENGRSGWCRAAGLLETAMNGRLKGSEGTSKRLKRRSIIETVSLPMSILIRCVKMLDNSLPRGFDCLGDHHERMEKSYRDLEKDGAT